MAREKINWLLILQGWAMLWVIIGHSPMGGAYGTDSEIVMSLRNFAYSFHMPCFVFISGFLFYLTRIKRNMKWSEMYVDKLERLGIPYVVFSFFTLIVKSFLGNEPARPVELSFHQLVMALISPGDGPLALLWFILVIMWFFAMSPIWKYVLERKALIIIVLFALLGLNLLKMPEYRILSVSATTQYCIYFYLGMIFSKYKLIEQINCRKIIILIAAVTIYIVARLYNLSLIAALSGIAFSIVLSLYADKFIPKLFSSFRNYTYQIYLMGIFFQIFIKLLCKKGFISNYELGITLNILSGIYMPVLISIIVKKINFRPLSICLGLAK